MSIERGQFCQIINSLSSRWAHPDGAGNPGHRGRIPLSNFKLSSDGGQLLLVLVTNGFFICSFCDPGCQSKIHICDPG